MTSQELKLGKGTDKVQSIEEITKVTTEEKARWDKKSYQKEYYKEWSKKNPEKRKSYMKKYRGKNKKKHSEHMKKWRKKNPEKNRAIAERYRKKSVRISIILPEELKNMLERLG